MRSGELGGGEGAWVEEGGGCVSARARPLYSGVGEGGGVIISELGV